MLNGRLPDLSEKMKGSLSGCIRIKVHRLEQDVGGGAVVGNLGDNARWGSVAWLPGIPEGAGSSFGVLFEREFQSINLATGSLFYLE